MILMFLRILKRELSDKVALNIALFLFLIIAAISTFIGSFLIYTNGKNTETTYSLCNTSDITIMAYHSLSDYKAQEKLIRNQLMSYPESDKVYTHEMIDCSGMIEFKDLENGDIFQFYADCIPSETNIPYDLDDNRLTVADGCVAIPQNMQNFTHTSVGDVIRLTTQMGNVYEFTVSEIYKNPSADNIWRMYFSDADFEKLLGESPVLTDCYELYLKSFDGDYEGRTMEIAVDAFSKLKEDDDNKDLIFNAVGQKTLLMSNEGTLSVIILYALILICVIMIMLIFITINFSLRSAIKREEKEIGAMKAIGVYSISYKAIFATKYIAFTIISGLIAIPVAYPLEKLLINNFIYNRILPPVSVSLLVSLSALVIMMSLIIGFVFLSLRRMDKISVMDAIQGENRGERFNKLPGFLLHKKKRMGVSLFLATNSILGKLKRYIYLILAYTLCICMVLLVVRVKDSILSEEYTKNYWVWGDVDFCMEFDDEYMMKLSQKLGSNDAILEDITENLAKNDVNVSLEYFNMQGGTPMYFGETRTLSCMGFGIPDTSEVTYTKGSTAPVFSNEVALCYYTANELGINLGDTVSIEYNIYNEDSITEEKVKKDFIVTAFYESFGANIPMIIMGQEFTEASSDGLKMFSQKLLCPDGKYDEYFEKMDNVYSDDEIRFINKYDVFNYMAGDGFEEIFNILIMVTILISSVVIILMTVLYQNIFIEEETSEIALQSIMGFSKGTIKRWQFLRMMILVGISVILAGVLIIPLDEIISIVTSSMLRVVHFNIIVRFLPNFVYIPICSIALVALVLLPALKQIDRIQIWRVRND